MRTLACFLCLLVPTTAGAANSTLPAAVQTALDDALALKGARVVALAYEPSLRGDCQVKQAQVPRPIEGSGRIAVKISGTGGCSGWAWVKVEVWAPVLVTTRLVRAGEPIEAAVTATQMAIPSGQVPAAMTAGAVASRSIPRGQMVQAAHIRGGASGSGELVKVVVVSGSLAVETSGRLITCGQDRACAVLASGRHVEGTLSDGRLIVEVR